MPEGEGGELNADEIDELAVAAFSKLDEPTRDSLARMTCAKAKKIAPSLRACSNCSIRALRRPCLLKSGNLRFVSLENEAAATTVDHEVVSPERSGAAALNVIGHERERRVVDITELGSPAGFRDQAAPKITRSREYILRTRLGFSEDATPLADGMTIGDYRCLGATIGATPVVVEFLVKLALAASNGQGLVVKLTLDGDDVKALLCLFQATAEASRLRTDDEDEEDDEDEDDDEDDEEERGARELTLSELCKTVLPEEALNEIRGALSRAGDSMGIRDEKVENMGYDRKRQMTRIAAFLIRQVLNVVKAGQKDPGGVLREVLKDRSIKVLDDDERGREDILKCPIVRTIAASYRIAARTKDRRLRKQLLSLLAVQPDLRYEDIIDICSDECDLVVGVDVRVQVEGGKGQQYRLARITGVSLDEETQESVSVVEYYDVSSDFKKRRHATMGQATTAYTSELENPNAAPSGREEDVARRRIKVLGAVNCTRDQIWKARVHAAQHFPGAPVPKQFFSRTRLTGPRAEQLALSLTPGGGDVVFAEASDRNIFRGVQFMRVEKRKTLWRRGDL